MRLLAKTWVQVILVAALGAGVGAWYRAHRSDELAWAADHYRLDQTIGFPISRGLPFAQQYVLDAEGRRVDVPLPAGQALDMRDATWWSLEDTGRMRLWNEEREEVLPTLITR